LDIVAPVPLGLNNVIYLLPAGVRIYLACGATDMRRGFDGLAMLAQEVPEQDPFSGHLSPSGPDEGLIDHPYIRNTPNLISGIGALRAAESASATTRRVSAGAMMPSSHRRAVA
jgi:transposase